MAPNLGRALIAAAAGAAIVTLPLSSAASDVEERIALDYSAASGCESRDDFIHDVRQWTAKAQLGSAGEAVRRFDVTIASAGGVYAARLVVEGIDGGRFSRSVSAETCAQATRALALMVALSIDPHAHASAEAAPAESPSRVAPSSGERAEPPADRPNTHEPSDRVAPGPAFSASTRPAVSLAVGADAEGLLLIESRPVFAWGAHVEVARPGGFSLRASFRRTFTTTVSTDSVGGRFTWTWARLDGCPVRFVARLRATVDLRPCVVGEIGEIDAAGVGGSSSSQRGRPWATLGALVRLAAHLGPFDASADVAIAAPLNREYFEFEPSPAVYRIPPVVAFSGLALAGEWAP